MSTECDTHLFICSFIQKFAEIIVYMSDIIYCMSDYYILYILDWSSAPGINIRLRIFLIINF